MKSEKFKLEGKVWLYKGNGPWHFVTIEKKDAKDIRNEYIWPTQGFGSIPVNVKIGETKWKTSVFPDKNKTYVLPLKKEVRTSENIKENDNIKFELEVINK